MEKDACESLQGISVATQHALRLTIPQQSSAEREGDELSESPWKTPKMFADAPSLSPESVTELFQKINSQFGSADVLINNAGVLNASGNIKDVDPTSWWQDMVGKPELLFMKIYPLT